MNGLLSHETVSAMHSVQRNVVVVLKDTGVANDQI